MNRLFVNYILCFFLCNFISYDICIGFDNKKIYYLINLYFFIVSRRQSKSVVTFDLGTLMDFQSYEDSQNNYETLYCSVTYLVAQYI